MGFLSFLVPMFCAKVFETNRLFPSTSTKGRYKDYPVFHLSIFLFIVFGNEFILSQNF